MYLCYFPSLWNSLSDFDNINGIVVPWVIDLQARNIALMIWVFPSLGQTAIVVFELSVLDVSRHIALQLVGGELSEDNVTLVYHSLCLA